MNNSKSSVLREGHLRNSLEMNNVPSIFFFLRPRLLPCLLSSIVLSCNVAQAQRPSSSPPSLGEVDTTWPGIRFQLLKVERIPPDRLLAVIRIVATRQAPASGTLIGTKVSVPANVTTQDLISARYAPRAFSLSASEMIHEQTARKFPALPPLASAGRSYVSGEILRTLLPGQAAILTVQFALPPGVASAETGVPKQTASFLLPNAKGPITKVPIPPHESVDDLSFKADEGEAMVAERFVAVTKRVTTSERRGQ
jgi:hypothetical protein